MEAINAAIERLSKTHPEHISQYGTGNEMRLTGKHETCDMNTFRSGFSSIHIHSSHHAVVLTIIAIVMVCGVHACTHACKHPSIHLSRQLSISQPSMLVVWSSVMSMFSYVYICPSINHSSIHPCAVYHY